MVLMLFEPRTPLLERLDRAALVVAILSSCSSWVCENLAFGGSKVCTWLIFLVCLRKLSKHRRKEDLPNPHLLAKWLWIEPPFSSEVLCLSHFDLIHLKQTAFNPVNLNDKIQMSQNHYEVITKIFIWQDQAECEAFY